MRPCSKPVGGGCVSHGEGSGGCAGVNRGGSGAGGGGSGARPATAQRRCGLGARIWIGHVHSVLEPGSYFGPPVNGFREPIAQGRRIVLTVWPRCPIALVARFFVLGFRLTLGARTPREFLS